MKSYTTLFHGMSTHQGEIVVKTGFSVKLCDLCISVMKKKQLLMKLRHSFLSLPMQSQNVYHYEGCRKILRRDFSL